MIPEFSVERERLPERYVESRRNASGTPDMAAVSRQEHQPIVIMAS
jgi:hypothetical protein